MLFLHGGGWMYGDLVSHDPVCRFLAERSGVQILAVDYRLAPEDKFPAAVEDAQAAYRWLVEHADDVDADPTHGWPSAATPPGAHSRPRPRSGRPSRACRWPSSC